MESGIDPGQEFGQDYYSYEHGYIFSFFNPVSIFFMNELLNIITSICVANVISSVCFILEIELCVYF